MSEPPKAESAPPASQKVEAPEPPASEVEALKEPQATEVTSGPEGAKNASPVPEVSSSKVAQGAAPPQPKRNRSQKPSTGS